MDLHLVGDDAHRSGEGKGLLRIVAGHDRPMGTAFDEDAVFDTAFGSVSEYLDQLCAPGLELCFGVPCQGQIAFFLWVVF